MTGFTDEQLAALQAPLAREHIKTREQAGRNVSYIEGWHVIAEANRIFGFDGWDRETSMSCVTEKETLIGRPPRTDRDPPQREGWRVAYVGKVRVTVRAGDTLVVREGSGYGSGIDVDLGAAHESAEKECETDCLKRSLMTFGNRFGLALYDKAQAGVEAPQKPADAPSRSRAPDGTASSTQPPARPAGTSHPRYDEAILAKDRIKAAFEIAKLPHVIDDIIRVNQADMDLINEVSPRLCETLRSFGTSRKTAMIAGTP